MYLNFGAPKITAIDTGAKRKGQFCTCSEAFQKITKM
jgi:hypothetical protein